MLTFDTGTAVVPGGEFQDISLETYRGKYLVLFFYRTSAPCALSLQCLVLIACMLSFGLYLCLPNGNHLVL